MSINPSIEAKAKGLTVDEVNAMHGEELANGQEDGDADGDGENNAEDGDATPKRPDDRWPNICELF